MLIRSVLFTPATRLDRLSRALESGADLVILDLEDGVGDADKDTARAAFVGLAASSFDGKPDRLGLRINSLSSASGIRDLAALLNCAVWPAVLVLPKVNAAAEIAQVVSLIADRATRLLITLETAFGLARAHDILSVAPKTALVGYGSADHMAETGGSMQPESLTWGRAQVVNAAASVGIPSLDGVWLDYKDQVGLTAEARLVQSMGFSGKIAIHPDQIAPINAVFTPSQAEIDIAREMISAAKAARGGAFSYNGKMVDAPVLARAHRLLDYAERSTS